MSTKPLPAQSSDFPAWYGEVVRRAGLAENAPVRGAMVIKPTATRSGRRSSASSMTGSRRPATRTYFPLLVPASVLAQEAELVEGFAPEVALVTEAGGKSWRSRSPCAPPRRR